MFSYFKKELIKDQDFIYLAILQINKNRGQMGKIQNNNEIAEVKDSQLNSFPYNRIVLISTKRVSSDSSKPSKAASKTYGTGFCISPYFVITSRFVISDNNKKVSTAPEITVYFNIRFQQEWLCYSYEVAEVMNMSETMEKSVSVLRLKTALGSHIQNDGFIGLLNSGKMVNKVEVISMQVKDWNFLNPNISVKHSNGQTIQVMQSLMYYNTSTDFGFGGAPLVIEKQGKKLVVGLHFGTNNKAHCNFGFCFTNDTMNELFNLLKEMNFIGQIKGIQISTGLARNYQANITNKHLSDSRMEEQKKEITFEESTVKEEDNRVPETANSLKPMKRLADPIEYPQTFREEKGSYNICKKEIRPLTWNKETIANFKLKENNSIITRLAVKPEERKNYIVSEPFNCEDKLKFQLTNLKEGKASNDSKEEFFSFGFVFEQKQSKEKEPISQLIGQKSFCYRNNLNSKEAEIICDDSLQLKGPMLKLSEATHETCETLHFNLSFKGSTCNIHIYKTELASQFTIKLNNINNKPFKNFQMMCFSQMTCEGCSLIIKRLL